MGKLIKVDGSERIVTPADGKQFTLEELQGYVGGNIQRIGLPGGVGMYLNEDGKGLLLEENKRATVLGRVAGIADDDFIVGDVVILSKAEDEVL